MFFLEYLREMQNLYEEHNCIITLNEPLDGAQVVAVERRLGSSLPPGLRAAWTLANGIEEGTVFFACPHTRERYSFLCASDALDLRERLDLFTLPFAEETQEEHCLALEFAGGKGGAVVRLLPDGSVEEVAPSWGSFLDASMECILGDPEDYLEPGQA